MMLCKLGHLPDSNADDNHVAVRIHATLEPSYPILKPVLHIENAESSVRRPLCDAELHELRMRLVAKSDELAGEERS